MMEASSFSEKVFKGLSFFTERKKNSTTEIGERSYGLKAVKTKG